MTLPTTPNQRLDLRLVPHVATDCSHRARREVPIGGTGDLDVVITVTIKIADDQSRPCTTENDPQDNQIEHALMGPDEVGAVPEPRGDASTSGAPIAALPPRQRQILLLASQGMTNAEIAGSLFLSVSTVERHCTIAYRALGVRNRAEALALMSTSRHQQRL